LNIDSVYENVTSVLFQFKPKKVYYAFLILFVAGLFGFVVSIFSENPERGWMAYLINLIYFMGISQAGIVFSAILFLTKAKWGRVFKRIAEGFGFFLPFSFILVLILIFGSDHLYPWIKHPLPEKIQWLNKPFFFIRNLIALGFLFSLSFLYIYYSIRPDAGYLIKEKGIKTKPLLGLFAKKWSNLDRENEKSHQKLSILSPIICIAYSVIFSFVGIDFVMSLDPNWVSTLFGAYIFMTAIFQALAATAIVSILIRKPFKAEHIFSADHYHDLGKLLFAFTMVCLDFFYSQFLVIWYGNLPEETHYIILRTAQTPWQSIAYSVLAVAFVIPFLMLISKKIKRSPRLFLIVALIILIGMWFERFILIAPSVWHNSNLPFGWQEIFITCGFFGFFGFIYLYFLENIPILPLTDPLLYKRKGTH
jgi:hypothetical protein